MSNRLPRFDLQSATEYLTRCGYDVTGMSNVAIIDKATMVRRDLVRLTDMACSKKVRSKS